MNKCTERLYNGLVKENPTFVLMLGMCPTLAVTTSAINGVGMGLSTTVVLIMSNMLISMLRKIIPDSVRMPAFIVIVASFVTIVQFLMEGFVPSLYDSLGFNNIFRCYHVFLFFSLFHLIISKDCKNFSVFSKFSEKSPKMFDMARLFIQILLNG